MRTQNGLLALKNGMKKEVLRKLSNSGVLKALLKQCFFILIPAVQIERNSMRYVVLAAYISETSIEV